ncbi:hypothetical protein MOQ_000169 [Trypanosoma cruzi marinkellei]|uniref:Uncharacterized protein n=1 Tax=Trypanosoma cruzi marinkellei TaxID=85056 RepID=K2NJN1_TRYCR|nr:hypothetical protein MOQ_000169 [Trypanosoma cruzi marinkellei]
MRSNGAGHLGNDTFMAVTRDDTENMYLVTKKLVEEPVTLYPLPRRVRFTPRSDIAFMDADMSSEAPPFTSMKERDAATPHSPLGGPQQEEVRCSVHTSTDGKLVAVISAGRLNHYLIDVLNSRVCEFKTTAAVTGVAWHPTSPRRLMLLLATGTLLLLFVGTAVLGVLFEDRQEFRLNEVVLDHKYYIFNGDNVVPMDQLEDLRGRKREALMPQTTPKAVEQKGAAFIKYREASPPAATRSTSSSQSAAQASKISFEDNNREEEEKKEEQWKEEDNLWGNEVITDNDTVTEMPEEAVLAVEEDKDRNSLIGMCIVPPSLSLPVMLLLLNHGGDVFSIKIDENGMPTALVKEFDGCVDTLVGGGEGQQQHRETGSSPCVHYLLRGGISGVGYTEDPLAIGTTLLDEDVGRHVVFVIYSSGVLRGGWFSEPDLLCRDLMRRQMDFTIQLDAAFSPHLSLPCFPSVAHLVGVQSCRNATLIRYNESAYLCVWPTWSRKAAGWVYRDEDQEGCLRVPVASQSAVMPEPIAVRLPYNVKGKSVAIGVNDILIFPETGAAIPLEGSACPRLKVVIAKIANLLLAAIYARGEKYNLAFDTVTTVGNEKTNKQKESPERDCLERLLELTAESYRRWLCGYPHESKDSITVELAKGVQAAHGDFLARQNALEKREEELTTRVQKLLQKQKELSQGIVHSQGIIRDAVLHRCGVDAFYGANNALGKAHKLLNELEALAADRRKAKRKAEASLLS